jgi:hypothetical protein
MTRVCSLTFILLTLLTAFGWAQLQGGPDGTLYDDFNQSWLDPAKWQPQGTNCFGSILECAREIRNGKLRLAVRNFGATNSDSGIQWNESEVYFVNPNAVTSITADVNARFSGVGCLTNNTDRTHTQVMFGGSFFNMGSGNPNDDMVVWLIIWIDTFDPTTMSVSVYWGHPWPGAATDVGFATYPVGTPLVATLTWDKANHQFIGKTKILDESELVQQVQIPYSVPDTMPPASPLKSLQASQHTLNCTSASTYGEVEATYDNVYVK